MNIAFLTPEYPHPELKSVGGLGTSIFNLVRSLVKQNVKVHVFVVGQNKNINFDEDGISFHIIKQEKYPFLGFYLYRKHVEKQIKKIIQKERIEVLEAPDWTGLTAFMNFDVPSIIRFHGSDTYFCHLENRKQKAKNRWFETLAIKGADAYIAPTQFAGKLSAELFGIPQNKVTTIHYGLELDNFNNSSPDKFEIGKILYIGTLIRKKGVLELPEILNHVNQRYPSAKLYLIGADSSDVQTKSSSTWELIQQKLQENSNNNVEYLGKVPYGEVINHIQTSHICVFPTYAETLGMVTIEAMAMNKAVVNSNIGWAKELIDDGVSGFLVHPTQHEDYAKKILFLLQNENASVEMGKEARKRVEQVFDMDKIVHQNLAFYKSIIKDSKR